MPRDTPSISLDRLESLDFSPSRKKAKELWILKSPNAESLCRRTTAADRVLETA